MAERWVLPFWLERQLDPKSPDFVPVPVSAMAHRPSLALPGGLLAEPVNITNRDWTQVGNLGSWRRATVDPRGLVTPVEGGWSLDWWVGADDRWHLPSREAAVRQRLIDNTPVVETSMRIPGGDVLHRAYGARAGDHELVVVEVENATAVPVAIALGVRAWHPTGVATIESIRLGPEGRVVFVNHNAALHLPKRPSRAAWSTLMSGDCADTVLAGAATELAVESLKEEIRDEQGFVQAALVFPLAHTAVLRVALPLRPEPAIEIAESALPSGTQVSSGWRIQGERGIRVDVPDQRLAAAIDSARRHLLLAHGGEDLASVPAAPMDFADAAAVIEALGVFGLASEAEQILSSWPERQRNDGWFAGADGRFDANGAALHAAGRHWQLFRSVVGGDELSFAVARAAHAIDRKRTGTRRFGKGPSAPRGFLPPGAGPPGAGPPGVWVRDAAWSLQGLADATALLVALAQHDGASEVAGFREHLRSALSDALAELPDGVWPSTLARGADEATIANLDALTLPMTREAHLAGAAETVRAIAAHHTVDGAVLRRIGPAGASPRHTAMLGRAELAFGGTPTDRLDWLLSHASPTVAWPEAQHPTRGGGTVGSGHDIVATAAFLLLARDLLVRETADRSLALATVWPERWLGQGLEVHDAPTSFGSVSYAVRWHGDRPALLWDLSLHDGIDQPVTLTVPGLDPSWSASAPKGEALLSVPAGAAERALDRDQPDGGSFS
ncbi:MAG: hypothetical protein HYX32_01380 [Actinobacteria bacterium]|nr:hypothetical protein [Actinomycetota bacterium]